MIKDFSGDFLNYEGTADGDVFTILDEGTDEFNQTLKKNIYNISVKRGDKVMKYSPNNNAGKLLQQSFGMDSKDWIGKQFEVFHINKAIQIRPIVIKTTKV